MALCVSAALSGLRRVSIVHSGFMSFSCTVGSYAGLYSTPWPLCCSVTRSGLMLVSIRRRGPLCLFSYMLGSCFGLYSTQRRYAFFQLRCRVRCWSLFYTVALCVAVALQGLMLVSIVRSGVILFSCSLGSYICLYSTPWILCLSVALSGLMMVSTLRSGLMLFSCTLGSYAGLYSTQWPYAFQLHLRVLCWSLFYILALCFSVASQGPRLVSILHLGCMLFSCTVGPWLYAFPLHFRILCWSLFYTVALCCSVTLLGPMLVPILHCSFMLFSCTLGSYSGRNVD